MENVILIAYVAISLFVILAGLKWIITIARLTIRLTVGLVKVLINVVMFPIGMVMKLFKE